MIRFVLDKGYSILSWLILKIFKKDFSRRLFNQLVKHYSVGFLGSVLNFTLFNLLRYNFFDTKVSNILTYVVVIIVSFLLQKFFTYKVDHHSVWQPVLFVASSLIYMTLETLLLVLLIDKLHLVPLAAKLITIVTLSPLSFIFQKFIVFKNKKKITDRKGRDVPVRTGLKSTENFL